MQTIHGFQRALDYLEENLKGEICYAHAAALAGCSEYHFQRLFSWLTGLTLGQYIRERRLTQAVHDLRNGQRVLDVALEYGYDSADGFARAFTRFHGLPPSAVLEANARFNALSPLHIRLTLEGGRLMDYHMVHRPAQRLLGYRRRFEGTPYGADRERQEEQVFVSTRAHQWLLRGCSQTPEEEIVALTDIGDEGYDFWYCADVDGWARDHLYDPAVTGIDCMDHFGFEELLLPEGDYAAFSTARSRHPVEEYVRLREQISTEWLPGAGFELRPAPELAIYHWATARKESRFIEILLPVQRAC